MELYLLTVLSLLGFRGPANILLEQHNAYMKTEFRSIFLALHGNSIILTSTLRMGLGITVFSAFQDIEGWLCSRGRGDGQA